MTLSEAGDVKIIFGNYNGKTMFEVLDLDPQYIEWMLLEKNDFNQYPEVQKAIKVFKNSNVIRETLNKE